MDSPVEISHSYLISPREKCVSCGAFSGPKISLRTLKGVSDLHRSNTVLAGPEREAVENDISNARAEISLLDQEIDNLQNALDSLKERRDELCRYEEQERSLLSPIRKLSEDLLLRIFLQVQFDLDSNDTGQTEFFRIATHVCTYWRSISTSCASLWSELMRPYYYPSKMTKLKKTRNAKLLEHCIVYSNNAPFSAYLGTDFTPDTLSLKMMKLLGQSAYRWRDITINSRKLLEATLACVPNDMVFQQLRSLTLNKVVQVVSLSSTPNLRIFNVHKATRSSSIILQHAPCLAYLTVRNTRNFSTTYSGIPLSQIIFFEAEDVGFKEDELPTILHSMPKLAHLGLTGDTNTRLQITLPQLAQLELYGPSANNVFDILTAPNLKSLKLSYRFDTANVERFARRSGCAIDEVHLHNIKLESDWDAPEFRSVKSLYWNHPRANADNDTSITRLTHKDDGHTIFPQLINLEIENISFIDDYDSGDRASTGNNDNEASTVVVAVIEVLKSRLPGPNVNGESTSKIQFLESVNIQFVSSLTALDMHRLEKFRRSDTVAESGVKITIKDMYGDDIV